MPILARARYLGVSAVLGVMIAGIAAVSGCSSRTAGHGSSAQVLETALTLARADPRLRNALASGERAHWELDGKAWAVGERAGESSSAREAGLGARLPLFANRSIQVGIPRSPETQVRLELEGAREVEGIVRGGQLLYPGAYGDRADVLFNASASELEELFVLHEPGPATFA
jgi:hypothetical protein